jgi:uncharacterized protein (TIGR02145 family)
MSNTIILTATNTQDGLPIIYRNTSCELKMTLTNRTGAEIGLQQNKTSLQISIPGITAEEIKHATIIAENWKPDIDDTTILLTYTGTNENKWPNKEGLTITITQLVTSAQPTTGNIQVNTADFTPKLPLQLFTPIAISNPTASENAKLEDVLQLTLDNGGTIYISSLSETDKLEELENELFLNIKNTGTQALYTGTKQITPRIEATFVYGNSIGCLTPASKEGGGTYAWDIHATVPYKTTKTPWVARQPSPTSITPCPKWIFEPESTNRGLIDVGPDANITFSFSKIISVTPPGHTQILLHFSEFMKDDTTAYDDALFVLDIVKQEAPKERGIMNFYSETPNLAVNSSQEKIKITLKWTAYYTDKVDILIHSPVVRYWSVIYPGDHLPVIKDCMDIELSGVAQDTVFLTVIQAYDYSGAFLGSRQFSIIVTANFFTDSRDGKAYPIINMNNQQWMAEDLKYETNQGSQSVAKTSDRVYNWEAAQSKERLKGWRLPSLEDWQKLIVACGDNAYDQLIKGGKSGFNAVLNGIYLEDGRIYYVDSGYYWTSEEDGTEARCAVFESAKKTISAEKNITQNKNHYLSVRYVRDLDNIE